MLELHGHLDKSNYLVIAGTYSSSPSFSRPAIYLVSSVTEQHKYHEAQEMPSSSLSARISQ